LERNTRPLLRVDGLHVLDPGPREPQARVDPDPVTIRRHRPRVLEDEEVLVPIRQDPVEGFLRVRRHQEPAPQRLPMTSRSRRPHGPLHSSEDEEVVPSHTSTAAGGPSQPHAANVTASNGATRHRRLPPVVHPRITDELLRTPCAASSNGTCPVCSTAPASPHRRTAPHAACISAVDVSCSTPRQHRHQTVRQRLRRRPALVDVRPPRTPRSCRPCTYGITQSVPGSCFTTCTNVFDPVLRTRPPPTTSITIHDDATPMCSTG
jgi:hypothetical protein